MGSLRPSFPRRQRLSGILKSWLNHLIEPLHKNRTLLLLCCSGVFNPEILNTQSITDYKDNDSTSYSETFLIVKISADSFSPSPLCLIINHHVALYDLIKLSFVFEHSIATHHCLKQDGCKVYLSSKNNLIAFFDSSIHFDINVTVFMTTKRLKWNSILLHHNCWGGTSYTLAIKLSQYARYSQSVPNIDCFWLDITALCSPKP